MNHVLMCLLGSATRSNPAALESSHPLFIPSCVIHPAGCVTYVLQDDAREGLLEALLFPFTPPGPNSGLGNRRQVCFVICGGLGTLKGFPVCLKTGCAGWGGGA